MVRLNGREQQDISPACHLSQEIHQFANRGRGPELEVDIWLRPAPTSLFP